MIYSSLSQSERIESLHPKFKQVFDYIKSNDLLHLELGRIELDGDNLFINNVNPSLVTADEQVLEAHKAYLDIHIPLDRNEIIGIISTEKCAKIKSGYDETNDYELYDDKPENFVTIHPGEFLIVYPEDAHAPLIGEGKIRKAVAKIKL